MTVIRLPSMVMGAPAPRWISRRSAAEDAVIRHSSTQAARPSRTISRSSEIASSSVSGVLSAERGRETSTSRQGVVLGQVLLHGEVHHLNMTALSLWTPRCDMPCSSRRSA